MVAWLSDGQRQEKPKQNKKICMLSNNRNYPYHSYWCYGGTPWPPSTGSINTVLGEISGATPLGSGVLVLPSTPSRTRLQKSDPAFSKGIDVMRPVFNLKSKCRVTMLTREEWTRRLGLFPLLKGSSGLQMSPGQWRGTGLRSMGNF